MLFRSSQEIEAQITANKDLLTAIANNYTQIEGGLILSTFLKLGALQQSGEWKESAGLKAMLNNTNEIAAYFGGTYAEALAGTKAGMTIIYHNGKLKSKDAEITGIIHAKGGEFDGYIKTQFKQIEDSDAVSLDSIGYNRGKWRLNKDLNIACSHCGIELPNSKDYLGSRVLIFNDCFIYTRGGDWTTTVTVQGGGKVYGTLNRADMLNDNDAPSSIQFASAIVEFVAIADPENANRCSWSILNYNQNTDYGSTRSALSCRIAAKVKGTSAGATIDWLGGFNDHLVSVKRMATGRYRVTFNKAYSSSLKYKVMVQGEGYVVDSTSSYCKATLLSQEIGRASCRERV